MTRTIVARRVSASEWSGRRRDPQAALFPLVSCRSSMVPSGSARRRGARSGVEAERPVVMRAVAPPARPSRASSTELELNGRRSLGGVPPDLSPGA